MTNRRSPLGRTTKPRDPLDEGKGLPIDRARLPTDTVSVGTRGPVRQAPFWFLEATHVRNQIRSQQSHHYRLFDPSCCRGAEGGRGLV